VIRALAVDTGEKRVGLAISGPGSFAVALPVLERTDWERDLDAIARIAAERGVETIVVGLPLNMNGTEGPRARAAREFGDALASRADLPVEYWDERLSSVEAEERLRAARLSRGKRRVHRNAVAAQVILEGWLASKGGR
jgi:putative Holliday junction resolvase